MAGESDGPKDGGKKDEEVIKTTDATTKATAKDNEADKAVADSKKEDDAKKVDDAKKDASTAKKEIDPDEPPPLGVAVPLAASGGTGVKTENSLTSPTGTSASGGESKRPSWDEMFQCLVAYKAERGDCYVSDRFKTKEGKCLGLWVRNQRREGKKWRRDKGIPDTKTLLEAALSEVKKEEDKTDDDGKKEGEDKKKEGDEGKKEEDQAAVKKEEDPELVPGPRPNKPVLLEDIRPSKLTDEQYKRLTDLGLDWNSQEERFEAQWVAKLELLKAYKLAYGDCKVPYTFEDDPSLAKWVSQQRTLFHQGRLPQHRLDQLNALDFCWKVHSNKKKGGDDGATPSKTGTRKTTKEDAQWEKQYAKLISFHEKNGHSRVPDRYAPDRSLGTWVKKQRLAFAHNRIKPERKEKLEKLGFLWRIVDRQNKEAWDAMLEKLKVYQDQNQGDLHVPRTTPQIEDRPLARWVKTQRELHKKGKLLPDRQERLEELGFQWEVKGGRYKSKDLIKKTPVKEPLDKRKADDKEANPEEAKTPAVKKQKTEEPSPAIKKEDEKESGKEEEGKRKRSAAESPATKMAKEDETEGTTPAAKGRAAKAADNSPVAAKAPAPKAEEKDPGRAGGRNKSKVKYF